MPYNNVQIETSQLPPLLWQIMTESHLDNKEGRDMDNITIFRLPDVLRKRYERKGRSWDALAKAISEANNGERGVDRRKLKRLCDGEDVYLSVSELLALDQYLRRFNEGLAENTIFYRGENILDSLAESEALTIFIAARYHQELKTETVSRWDMRAVTRFTRTKLAGMHIDIQDVLLWDRIEQIKDDDWIKMLKDDRAKVTIGSPLACPASEYLMARMVNLTPYQKEPLDMDKPLPFYFLFPDESDCPSTFFIQKSEAITLLQKKVREIESIAGNTQEIKESLTKKILEIESLKGDDRAIIVSQDVFISTRVGASYALLVAQRQPPVGQVVMSLCGTYGSTTLGLANVVTKGEINAALPKFDSNKKQPLLVAVIEVITAPRSAGSYGPQEENRRLVSARVVRAPRFFNLSDGRWVEK